MIKMVIAFLIAYFIGNISPSTIMGRRSGIDIKKEGSGNAGTTNALRVLGKKAAVITLCVDILKGVVAVLIGSFAAGSVGAYGCALCVILGHIWPMVYKFKGGKGVATGLGVLCMLMPQVTGIVFLIWLVIVKLTGYVSLGSIVAAICVPVLAFIFHAPAEYLVFGVIAALLIVVRHKANIGRLLNGTESKIKAGHH